MRTIVVVNPHAGRQAILKELDEIMEIFTAAGHETELVKTESKAQADQVIRSAIAKKPDLLVCAGGDGTLSETVNQMLNARSPVRLGYIPAGSTNDFATALNLPKEPVKAAQRIVNGSITPIDVGRFGYKYFIYVASFGAFTQSSYNTTQSLKNSLGHLAYVLEGIKELPTLQSYHVQVETEAETFDGDYVFGAVSNSTSLGGVIRLDDSVVDMADGKLELTLVKTPENLGELNKILFSLMSGKYDPEVITFKHVQRAAFSCAEAMPWSLDGEYAAGGEKVEIEAVPHAVELVI